MAGMHGWMDGGTFFFLPFLTRNSSTEAGLGMSQGAL